MPAADPSPHCPTRRRTVVHGSRSPPARIVGGNPSGNTAARANVLHDGPPWRASKTGAPAPPCPPPALTGARHCAAGFSPSGASRCTASWRASPWTRWTGRIRGWGSGGDPVRTATSLRGWARCTRRSRAVDRVELDEAADGRRLVGAVERGCATTAGCAARATRAARDAWPTGKPTVRLATASASVWSTSSCHARDEVVRGDRAPRRTAAGEQAAVVAARASPARQSDARAPT